MKVLFVDDNKSVLAAFRRNMRKHFSMTMAESAAEAIDCLKQKGPFAVIVSDMKMPGMNGVEFLEEAIKIAPSAVRIMLTGNADQQTATDAVNRGHVYRFLNKPCSVDDLVAAVNDAGEHFSLMELEHSHLESTVAGCVKMLTDLLGIVAPFALGRGQALKASMSPFLSAVNIKSVWQYEVAALLSSVGYASLPAEVVTKLEEGEELSSSEREVVRNVPEIGYELVKAVPKLGKIASMIRFQSKHFDGTGFPSGDISGQAIPLGSRLLKIFEDRAALEKEGMAGAIALQTMKARVGFYDPKILEMCFKYYPNYLTTSISKDKPVQSLYLEALEAGDVVVSDIHTSSGLLLVEAGNVLTGATIQRIRNYATLGQVDGPFYVQREEAEAEKQLTA